MKKRCLSAFFALLLALQAAASALSDARTYIEKTVPKPEHAYAGGEWAVVGLAESGGVPDAYAKAYYAALRSAVNEKGAILHERKRTENARAVIALAALGKSPYSVGGADILSPLEEVRAASSQGLNGAVFALLALDAAKAVSSSREVYIAAILAAQGADGGFAVTGGAEADVDLTAMALAALAPYRARSAVKTAVGRGLAFLEDAWNETGGYGSAECTAQIVIALVSLGISPDDSRFVHDGKSLSDELAAYAVSGGGYRHLKSDKTADLMASEQALLALTALANGRSPYAPKSTMRRDAAVKKPAVIRTGKRFADVKNAAESAAVTALYARGVINGKSEETFAPLDTMTRAEFAAVVTRSLGLVYTGAHPFTDVGAGAWYEGAVLAAYRYGITTGTSAKTFSPDGTITRQEAYTMLARAAGLCGMDTDVLPGVMSRTAAGTAGFDGLSAYAKAPMAFAVGSGIAQSNAVTGANVAVSRAEIAVALYKLLERSAML